METNAFDCPHCSGSGTCTVDDAKSCGTCQQTAKLKNEAKVVRCGVCLGYGKLETKTTRLTERMPFLIVFAVIGVFYFYAALNAGNDEKFAQIFPLVGSLTTMIVTFYFSKK